MKKLLFLFVLFTSISHIYLHAQCGQTDTQTVVFNQSELDELASCEIFSGDLIVSSINITNVNALFQLSVVSGNFYLLNTAVTDLSPLASLNSAIYIQIQGNTSLTSCCELLQFAEAVDLGSIMNVSFSDNGVFCDNNESIMLYCLGYIEGCIDSTALNFSLVATVDDGTCEYFCPESYNDMQDYSCNGDAYPENCEPVILNKPSNGAGHFNYPLGLCYDENPPSSGPHRSMWGRWGEYEYMPAQRYIHNLEHGGITLLYNPCVNQDIIDSLRTLTCSRPDDDGGPFRWVLTPYVGLETNIAIIAWEWTYTNNCFEATSINEFIDEHYRNAPEDFYYNGSYDTLYLGKCDAYGCMDQTALNYNPLALITNGSCSYPIIDTQIVSFVNGWSIFSTYIEPQFTSMDSIFLPIINQTTIVKNNTGQAFLPAWGMDLETVNGQGYQAKIDGAAVLEILGTQLQPELNPIELNEGWNLIAYLREQPADCILVFEDIADFVTIVKDSSGNVYFPEWGFSNIDQMLAGQGYHVKMSTSSTLNYLANDEDY